MYVCKTRPQFLYLWESKCFLANDNNERRIYCARKAESFSNVSKKACNRVELRGMVCRIISRMFRILLFLNLFNSLLWLHRHEVPHMKSMQSVHMKNGTFSEKDPGIVHSISVPNVLKFPNAWWILSW